MPVYHQILNNRDKKQFAVLIDPDKYTIDSIVDTIMLANDSGVDFFLVGGSLLISDGLDRCITSIKENTDIPVILFPGSTMQINKKADAILFLSLISGRNPDLLIGNHVIAAPYIKQTSLEAISTGYMIIDSGKATTASYMSQSFPIPYDKDEIAVCTALAGEMLGLKMIYLDGGSGADTTISPGMVESVKKNIAVPLVVGGGIRSAESASEICRAGADLIVVGNAIEDNRDMIPEIAKALRKL
ncbi:MAG: geranylgeranylglyceryl/heptaprenylglyceryl phosphate synthase [Bacteroidota bacterium]|nr:geranylgeranylglyceryl/heptaprenylglyceryl phosphate synthase [Bacteroidota bacterium]